MPNELFAKKPNYSLEQKKNNPLKDMIMKTKSMILFVIFQIFVASFILYSHIAHMRASNVKKKWTKDFKKKMQTKFYSPFVYVSLWSNKSWKPYLQFRIYNTAFSIIKTHQSSNEIRKNNKRKKIFSNIRIDLLIFKCQWIWHFFFSTVYFDTL